MGQVYPELFFFMLPEICLMEDLVLILGLTYSDPCKATRLAKGGTEKDPPPHHTCPSIRPYET